MCGGVRNMDLTWSGTAAEAVAWVAEIAGPAGWTVDAVAGRDGLYELRPCRAGAAPGECGWLVAAAAEGGTRVTVWLPETGDPTARERLESGLESGLPAAGEGADQAVLRRLRRVEGQIRGLQRMIAQERGCEEVMTQLAAATTALKQTAARVVSEHFAICYREAMASGQDVATLNQRLLNILF